MKTISRVLGVGVVGLAAVVAGGMQAGQPEGQPPAPAQPAPQAPKPPAAPEQPRTPPETPPVPAPDPYVLGFTMKLIDGKDQPLDAYKGKVVMIVNTASQCGYTPQYAQLEKLYQEHKDRGFVVLAFPANNFGNQEPEGNEKIKEFCESTYHITFPLFAKVSVKGPDACDLFKRLAAQPAPIGGEPKWNFTKFLVDREGRVVARYAHPTKPMDSEIVKRIDELLGPRK